MRLSTILDVAGLQQHDIRYPEVLISAIGGFIGIAAIYISGQWLLDPQLTVLIIPSMGATAVLLFAAPHAPFSQPWNVIVGHTLSALIGVACWQWIADIMLAASASVGISIGIMYITRSIHPPGGATALAAVIGSEQLHTLGFTYPLQPVLMNVCALMISAIALNWIFRWRRYPVHSAASREKPAPLPNEYPPISHEDFVYALSQVDTFVDISEEDLVEIYYLATQRDRESVSPDTAA